MRELSYDNFLRLLAAHQPVEIRREHIESAEGETADQLVLVEIAENYPTIVTTPIGGYRLPTEILPFRFRARLMHEGIGTPGMWSGQTGLIEEMISNAMEHGNGYDKDKSIHLLWHQCPQGKEVYVVDEGEVDFDLDERLKGRRALSASFGKDDYSGLDVLRWDSKAYEFFTIRDAAQKRGTLLRIALELPSAKSEGQVECNYIGHQLFAQPPS